MAIITTTCVKSSSPSPGRLKTSRAPGRSALTCPAMAFRTTFSTKSLFGNYERRCGEGFWLWPRRPWPRAAPAAGCKERVNAGYGQKTRRLEGFRGKGRLASLLRGGRAQRLLRRASPSGLFPENSAPRSFQTGSKPPIDRVRGAFTLLEYVIGIGIGSLVLLTILSLSLYSGKSFAGLANYVDL